MLDVRTFTSELVLVIPALHVTLTHTNTHTRHLITHSHEQTRTESNTHTPKSKMHTHTVTRTCRDTGNYASRCANVNKRWTTKQREQTVITSHIVASLYHVHSFMCYAPSPSIPLSLLPYLSPPPFFPFSSLSPPPVLPKCIPKSPCTHTHSHTHKHTHTDTHRHRQTTTNTSIRTYTHTHTLHMSTWHMGNCQSRFAAHLDLAA